MSLACILALFSGACKIPPVEVLRTILSTSGITDSNHFYDVVIFQIRIPRILLAISVGSALSVAGCVYQGVFKNPLVEPYILGVSSGAAFGAALSIVMGLSLISQQMTALAFALISTFAAYSVATKSEETPIINLILSGIVINALFTAGISFLKTVADSEQLRSLTFWLMGGIYVAEWDDVMVVLPVIIVFTGVLWAKAWTLNIMTLSKDEARTLGVNTDFYKKYFIFFSAIIASVSVATVGVISWIGLIVPHIARIMVGPDHRMLIPSSMLMGATFTLLCDTLARTLTTGEVPITILTSLFAGPYLIYLIRNNRAIYFD